MTKIWKILILIALILQIGKLSEAHPWKPDHFVIIDTDCGFDDYRAINMLLASSSVRVLAIITSNGVIGAEDGYFKLNNMLNQYYHRGILIGMNNLDKQIKEGCKPALDFKWSENIYKSGNIKSHLDIIKEVLKNSGEQITFINLGSLSTYHSALKNIPEFKARVKKTLWSCNYGALKEEFNYLSDTSAYYSVKCQNIKLSMVNGNVQQFNYQHVIDKGLNILNIYAKNFERSLKESNSPFSKVCYDESLVIYLHKPEYFVTDSSVSNIYQLQFKDMVKSNEIENEIKQIIDGQTINQNQVFSRFPMDSTYYTDEIQVIMPHCIEKYGRNEWIATVMANEMHRHLGIYAVIGTKMGMRAREHFGAGIDEMQVISYAGSTPPYSCMNDGLQISTGATLGHGLIKLQADTLKLPNAEFIYMNRKITICLKDEYRKKVELEIKNLVALYGLDTNLYWNLVRQQAISYWKYWDRHEIFDLTEND